MLATQLLSLPPLTLSAGMLHLAPDRCTCTVRGQAVSLTKAEFTLLYQLTLNAGRIVSYEELFTQLPLRGNNKHQLLASQVKRLRNALFPGDKQRRLECIETRRSLGLMLHEGAF